MKRIHLFEFEDLTWFPDWIRVCMTRMIIVMHKMLNSPDDLSGLIAKMISYTNERTIIDLCSGSGGPMIEVFKKLKKDDNNSNLKLILTDLYPDPDLILQINNKEISGLSYKTSPVNAVNVSPDLKGIRTMICSFHHMKPDAARNILKNAKENKYPICIYEISDNSTPVLLWWISMPVIFLMAFIITLFVRPLTLKQVIFTYCIPVIPFFYAWDGAVSNVRTYSLQDMDTLLDGLGSDDYKWEKGTIKGKAKKLYLLGIPVKK